MPPSSEEVDHEGCEQRDEDRTDPAVPQQDEAQDRAGEGVGGVEEGEINHPAPKGQKAVSERDVEKGLCDQIGLRRSAGEKNAEELRGVSPVGRHDVVKLDRRAQQKQYAEDRDVHRPLGHGVEDSRILIVGQEPQARSQGGGAVAGSWPERQTHPSQPKSSSS